MKSKLFLALFTTAAASFATAGATFETATPLTTGQQASLLVPPATELPSRMTVWFTYTAPKRGKINISTQFGENYLSGLHITSIYWGNTADKLNIVERPSSNAIKSSFFAEQGMKFTIGVEIIQRLGTEDRPFTITAEIENWNPGLNPIQVPPIPSSSVPVNDNFENPITIPSTGVPPIVLCYSGSATNHSSDRTEVTGNNTLWYRWVAPRRGILRVHGSNAPDHLSIYRGNSASATNLLASHIAPRGESKGSIEIPVEAGLEYRICAGWISSTPSISHFQAEMIGWPYGTTPIVAPRLPNSNTPRNDLFESATPLPNKRGKYTILDYALDSTTGPDAAEITDVGYGSLWYRWTAPESTIVEITTPGNRAIGYHHRIGVFTGSYRKLKTVASLDSNEKTSMRFVAKKGTTYHFAHGSTTNEAGSSVVFHYESSPRFNTTAPKVTITNTADGLSLKKKSFKIKGTISSDPEGIGAIQVKAGGKLVHNKKHTKQTISIGSGKLKSGKVKIQVRASDGIGKWGPWSTVTVKVP